MMDESLCGGLPPEICEQLSVEEQIIKIRLEKRRFGREVTIIEGINEKEFNLKNWLQPSRADSQQEARLRTGA